MKLSEILLEIENTLLQEKLLQIQNGANYGQAVFVSGGSGSGKSFAIQNFMEGKKFKIFDVDEWKRLFLKIQDLKGKYSELEGLELSDPNDVYKLHKFVKDRGIKMGAVQNLLDAAHPDRLPNVIFDVTMKDYKKLDRFVPLLKGVGYENQNIHIVWVLTNYYIAVERNRDRERIVPDDIVLKTHEGAAETMVSLIKRGLPYSIDGGVYVILNNPDQTVHFKQRAVGSGPSDEWPHREDEPEAEETKVIKDFTYLTLKEPGGGFKKDKQVMEQLQDWIVQNVPKTVKRPELTTDNKKMHKKAKEAEGERVTKEEWMDMMNEADPLERYLREKKAEKEDGEK